jgi:hydrogenase maturation protease
MRTLIGGVGARDQSDHAIGLLISDRLAHDAPIIAAHVVVEDLSFDPASIAQRLNEEWPRFERVIFVGAVARSRPAGTVDAYRWNGELPSDDRIQTAFDGALAGVVSLENTLLVLKQLGDLPDDVIVVEVEPEVARMSGNDELSAVVAVALERAHTLVRRFATNSHAAGALPRTALGGASHAPREVAD